MAGRGKITPAERRRQDYLRRRVLRTASVYETRLASDRRKELRRVLGLALDLTDPEDIPALLDEQISETSYLPAWWTGLWTDAGLPMAKTTAQTLRQAKAAAEDDIWLATLRGYAQQRAANEIRVVTGTWKDSLVRIVRDNLEADLGLGIEKLTKRIYADYVSRLEKWQVRRIAQTEAMIGMADASDLAAKTIEVPFTKQWCISGLGNTRESHEAMDGVTVDQDEPFVLPGGMLLYPHDTSLSADASEIINCACDCIRRSKASSVLNPSPVKPVTEPTPEPAPQPKPAPAPKPPKPKTPAAPAPETFATITETATEEQRIVAIMAEMDQSLPEATRRAIAKNDLELEKALGVKKGKPMAIDKADKQSANPLYGTADQYGTNCATCSPAYILRTRGFDITAKGRMETDKNKLIAHGKSFDVWKNADGTPAKPTILGDWMKAKGYTKLTSKRYKEFLEESCKAKGDYILTIKWKGKSTGAHATVLHRGADGKLVNIEPQHFIESKGATLDIVTELCDYVHGTRGFEKGVLRVDDKIFDVDWASLFNAK
jgi:hypothetical protein